MPSLTMLCCGEQIRLTAPERQQLALLTGVDPGYIRTRPQLEEFVQRYAKGSDEDSFEARLLRSLLETFLPPAHA